jgi:hypothetical protein
MLLLAKNQIDAYEPLWANMLVGPLILEDPCGIRYFGASVPQSRTDPKLVWTQFRIHDRLEKRERFPH